MGYMVPWIAWYLDDDTYQVPPQPPVDPSAPASGLRFALLIPEATGLAARLPSSFVNHGRTLLLNAARIDLDSVPGEEYIPASFSPLRLPAFLTRLRAVLFGSDPDRLTLNYRVRQLMLLLHTTELDEFVRLLDPRVTYLNNRRQEFFGDAVFVPTVLKYPGTTGELFLMGNDANSLTTGRSEHQWTVEVLDSSDVRITRRTPPQIAVEEVYVLTDGLSDIHNLPGSKMQFRFSDDVAGRWRITNAWRPAQDLGTLLATTRTVGDATIEQLFGLGTAKAETEPFATFYRLWKDHPHLPYALGGLLLAMIYRTEEVRLGGLRND